MRDLLNGLKKGANRRSFLKKGMAAGATVGGAVLGGGVSAFADGENRRDENGERLTRGDAALLRFAAAIEILETDFWIQYNELGGVQDSEVPGGSGNPVYTAALAVLDSDMAQYIHDNTDDEITHFTFLNAYLASKGAETVNLERFRTLPGSTATGSSGQPRLTNLMELTLDTSCGLGIVAAQITPISIQRLCFRKQSLVCPWDNFRRFPEAMPTSPPLSTFRQSPTQLDSICRPSNKAALHFTLGWRKGRPVWKSCESSLASAPRRRCTSKPGRTKPAMLLL